MPLNPFGNLSIEFGRDGVKTAPRRVESTVEEALNHGFVVVDVETTGVFPKRDRVLEIAIISCTPDLAIEDVYTTLINPERDLGATDVHQITAAMLRDAPKFHEVAGDILKRIGRRAVIGHNVRFDISLLSGEYERMGLDVPAPAELCTMKMSYKLGPAQRKLISCCEHFGITHARQHSAVDDAHAALNLVRAYRAEAAKQGKCFIADLAAFVPGDGAVIEDVPKGSGKTFTRVQFEGNPKPSYLQRLLSRLPDTGGLETAAYCHALDRVLEDRRVTLEEMEELQALAEQVSLSRAAVTEAHRDYLRGLVLLALEDEVITAGEMKDLVCVNQLLGFEDEHLSELISHVRSQPREATHSAGNANASDLVGKKVCFTGAITSTIDGKAISRDQALKFAADHGLIATDSVTKATDILVLADPDSMSGKAKKARQYGTRLMSDRAFWILIGVRVD